jgi:hypothetical protein
VPCRSGLVAFVVLAFTLGGALPARAQQPGPDPAADPTADPAAEAPAPAALPSGSIGGMGDINLFPKRVVIDDRQRLANLGLYNRSAATGEYEITVSDMAMQPDGRLVELESITDPAARAQVHTASGFLRWSPRRVSLPGSEAQMVRIMARVAPDLPPGEYRSHFTVVSVPPETGGTSIDEATGALGADGIGVRIVPRFGISIPVIVRVGQTTLTAGLKDFALITQPGGSRALSFKITREGTRSAFGDITVTAPGAKKPVGEVKGIGVYTEIAERSVLMVLDPAADPRLLARGARLSITYVDDDAAPGKTLAKQEFVVP